MNEARLCSIYRMVLIGIWTNSTCILPNYKISRWLYPKAGNAGKFLAFFGDGKIVAFECGFNETQGN
jgi:hypothetical protein